VEIKKFVKHTHLYQVPTRESTSQPRDERTALGTASSSSVACSACLVMLLALSLSVCRERERHTHTHTHKPESKPSRRTGRTCRRRFWKLFLPETQIVQVKRKKIQRDTERETDGLKREIGCKKEERTRDLIVLTGSIDREFLEREREREGAAKN